MMARFPFLLLVVALFLGGAARCADSDNKSVIIAPAQEKTAAPARVERKPDDFESRPLRGGGTGAGRQEAEAKVPSAWSLVANLIGGLLLLGAMGAGVVIAIRRFLPGARPISGKAAEILGRTSIDGKRYMALVRVGRRVLVVGVSPEGMRSLSEITDPEEVAEIMRTARPASDEGKGVFLKLLQGSVNKQHEKIEDAVVASKAPGGESAELEREVAEIRSHLRGLRGEA